MSAATAAAWGDIQRTLSQRNSGVKVLFSPATVQGFEAPSSIVKAIERVNHDGRAEVIILARGGGAVEDLFCFNDERVVRAIASIEEMIDQIESGDLPLETVLEEQEEDF